LSKIDILCDEAEWAAGAAHSRSHGLDANEAPDDRASS
jgi:hypothetical protein